MSKIPGYDITKKIKVENKPKKDCITILITEENYKHLEKCLYDPAFVASISKLILKKNPDDFFIKIGILKPNKSK